MNERLSDGAWHHIVIIRDLETEQVFIDGELVSERPAPRREVDRDG